MSNKSLSEKIKAASTALDPSLLEEDGWIFRERPGLPVECVRRASDAHTDMTPPNQIRHNYPSA